VKQLLTRLEYYDAVLELPGDGAWQWQWLQKQQIMAGNVTEKSVPTAIFDGPPINR